MQLVYLYLGGYVMPELRDPKELKKYYKKGYGPTEKVVEKELKTDPDMILHGNRAINMQLPKYLQVYTEDYDIFSTNPKQDAKRIEKILDERYSGNFFEVRPSPKFADTFNVFSRVTKRKVADLTKYDVDIPFKEIDSIKVATLDHHLERIEATLRDSSKKSRWDKDKETRQRILLYKGKK